MVYLWIFLGLLVAVIGLSIANVCVKKAKDKREDLEKGE